MAFNFVSPANRTAWLAASNQEAQLAIVTGAFPGSVELRYFSAAGTLLDTVTHSGWDLSATNPRYLSPRGISARSFAASAAAAYVIAAVPGGAEILRADVALSGNVAASRRTNLGAGSGADGLRIVANSALPVDALPAWLSGGAVGQWAQIAGTSSPAELKDFCGLAWRDEDGAVWAYSAANGGHAGNELNNRVMAVRLDVDAPSWQQLRAGDSSAGWNQTGTTSPYFPNGKPAPRHTYADIWWQANLNRVVLGGNFWGSSAATYSVIDGFRLSDNDWDAEGTFPARLGFAYEAVDPADGVRYSTTGYKWVPGATPALSGPVAFNLSGAATTGNQGSAFDTLRGNIFHLSFGNGTSAVTSPAALNAAQINKTTGAKTQITFNASAAYTTFLSERDVIYTHSVRYDSTRDCFYLYNGQNNGPAPDTRRIYKVTPNSGTAWDISIIPGTGGVTPGPSLTTTTRGGVNNKFIYLARWDVCLLVVPDEAIYFMRMP